MTSDDRATREGILDELPFGIWVGRAPFGEVLYTNRSFREVVGMEAVSGAGVAAWSSTYGIFDRQGRPYPAEKLAFSRALASGGPVVVDDLVLRRSDGSQVCVRAFANPVRDAHGAISHVILALSDITAEVRAMLERAELEKHLEVAIHHAPVLLFMIDREGVLTAADGALRAMLESETHKLVGQSLFVSYRDNAVVVDNLRRALSGETVSYSVQVRGLSLDVWIGPVRNAGGDVTGGIGVATDVTEARRAQSTIIQEDRIRAMGMVAASVAHEINNPLTYVLANLDGAEKELERLKRGLDSLGGSEADKAALLSSVAHLKQQLGPIVAGTKRIRDIARELKSFTRPDSDQLERVHVPSVVFSVLSLLRKEIEARARLVEQIGECPPVRANEARLVQVLTNLFMNAWQAIPASDPAGQVIGVRTGSVAGDALIEVWDSGSGVPSELRERIFEPFVTTKEVGAGTGLGLFVCRNIVNALQGQISVHDAPSGGALFRITLPAMSDAARAPASSRAVVPPARQRTLQRRVRVLIIDDDSCVASALASQLTPDKFEVRTETDARAALALLLADADFDLVYCDVMMRELTGIEIFRALREKAPERVSKVVFMSGGAFTAEARAFLDRLGERHVQKPFDIRADAHERAGLAP